MSDHVYMQLLSITSMPRLESQFLMRLSVQQELNIHLPDGLSFFHCRYTVALCVMNVQDIQSEHQNNLHQDLFSDQYQYDS